MSGWGGGGGGGRKEGGGKGVCGREIEERKEGVWERDRGEERGCVGGR